MSREQRENLEAPWWAGLVVFGLIYAAHWVQTVSAARRLRQVTVPTSIPTHQ